MVAKIHHFKGPATLYINDRPIAQFKEVHFMPAETPKPDVYPCCPSCEDEKHIQAGDDICYCGHSSAAHSTAHPVDIEGGEGVDLAVTFHACLLCDDCEGFWKEK